MRRGAVVAYETHHLEGVGSIPTVASKFKGMKIKDIFEMTLRTDAEMPFPKFETFDLTFEGKM
ncbi:MAG: hypothetical protein QXN55_00730 [Candidatus Nitrosotenuis sp.]